MGSVSADYDESTGFNSGCRHLCPDESVWYTHYQQILLRQPQGNIYGAKLISQQVGLNRLGESSNFYFVGASAGYPSAPGVISNGMDVVELITGQTVRHRSKAPQPLAMAS